MDHFGYTKRTGDRGRNRSHPTEGWAPTWPERRKNQRPRLPEGMLPSPDEKLGRSSGVSKLVSEDRRNGSVMPWRGGWIYRSPSRPSASAASAQTSPSPIAMRATIAYIESRCQISTRTQPDTDEHSSPRPATPPESGPPGIRGVARLPNCPGSNALQPTAIEALLRPSGSSSSGRWRSPVRLWDVVGSLGISPLFPCLTLHETGSSM